MATHWHLVTTPALITEETCEQDHVIHCTDWSLRGNTLNGDGPASNFQFQRNNCQSDITTLLSPDITVYCAGADLWVSALHWSVVSGLVPV